MKRDITPKQLEILQLIADGFNSIEIAKQLGNSKKTIDSMRLDMMNRVDANNAAHLVAYALRNKLIH